MKKMIILTMIILSISCSIPYGWNIDEDIKTIDEARKIMLNIKYEYENGDNWKMPENTYISMLGDCEDQAGLLACIFIYNLHYESVSLSVGYLDNGERHMVVKYNGDYWNAQNVWIINDIFTEQYTIEYETYLFLAKIR